MSMLATAAAVLSITVRVYDLYGLTADQRAKAFALAGETLARATVATTWVDCTRQEGRDMPPVCRAPLTAGHIVLRVQARTDRGPHILGSAVVQTGGPNVVASVYAASVNERSIRTGLPVWLILGRVSAHEIGHLLLGANSHTASGLMRARWDLKVPYASDWQFTDEDAAKIRSRMLPRAEAVVASANE